MGRVFNINKAREVQQSGHGETADLACHTDHALNGSYLMMDHRLGISSLASLSRPFIPPIALRFKPLQSQQPARYAVSSSVHVLSVCSLSTAANYVFLALSTAGKLRVRFHLSVSVGGVSTRLLQLKWRPVPAVERPCELRGVVRAAADLLHPDN